MTQLHVGSREAGVSRRLGRILLDGFLEVRHSFQEILDRPFLCEVVSKQVSILRFGIRERPAFRSRLFCSRELRQDLPGNGVSDFSLQTQQVAEITLITLSPQVPVRLGVNQLRTSFSQGTPIQVSTYRQQVIVNTTTNAFVTVHMNTITQTDQFTLNGQLYQLGFRGKSFRTAYSGQSNAPGLAPSGWFSGYAVGVASQDQEQE